MTTIKTNIRSLRQDDFDAVVAIDEKVFQHSRSEYFQDKFARALDEKNQSVISLVAEVEGRVSGFVMCELFGGEYGILETEATLDTIGIHPDYQLKGVGRQLMDELTAHLKKTGVIKLSSLAGWNDFQLVRFFSATGFKPSETINLELRL